MRCRWDPVYPDYWRRPSTHDADLRASDAERSEVADRLSSHFADGRLDQIEFKARLDRAMGATTRGDLDGLFDDLPALPQVAPPPRRHHRFLRAVALVVLVAVVLGSTVPFVHIAWVPALVLALVLWRIFGGHHPRREYLSEGKYDRRGPRP
jgi:hypothetical protein